MSEIVLKGIDGANPLGFLAALGTLRTSLYAWPDEPPQMRWCRYGGSWRPVLHFESSFNEEEIASRLHQTLQTMKDHPAFGFADNLSVPPETFREEARVAALQSKPHDRAYADFVAAFGTDIIADGQTGNILDTAFRTMSGAGHQHFLSTIRRLVEHTNEEQIRKTLFSIWLYDDPIKKHTMRWDPVDDVRYALQWQDPSGDANRDISGSMWGANRLAVEALPLFPTSPNHQRLMTTGFTRSKGSNPTWTWPIWEPKISMDIVRSLLSLEVLQNTHPDRGLLKPMGVVEAFRCQRLTQGKFRNFTPAEPVV